MPLGTMVHNIEMQPGQGERSQEAQVLQHSLTKQRRQVRNIKMPSGN
jgi:ribosomal protein L2